MALTRDFKETIRERATRDLRNLCGKYTQVVSNYVTGKFA